MLTGVEFTPKRHTSDRDYIRPLCSTQYQLAIKNQTINMGFYYPRRKYKFTITTQLPFTKFSLPCFVNRQDMRSFPIRQFFSVPLPRYKKSHPLTQLPRQRNIVMTEGVRVRRGVEGDCKIREQCRTEYTSHTRHPLVSAYQLHPLHIASICSERKWRTFVLKQTSLPVHLDTCRKYLSLIIKTYFVADPSGRAV